MTLLDILAIAAPALLVVIVALCLVLRGRGRRDVVLDLRDVPTVVLATRGRADAAGPRLGPVSGALVDPVAGGSLGARMRSAEPAAPVVDDPLPAPRVVRVRRRRRPLVAVSREPSPR